MTELKPCPFCGGNPVIKYDDQYYWIECEICYVKTRELNVEDYGRGMKKTRELCIEAWNRRVENG